MTRFTHTVVAAAVAAIAATACVRGGNPDVIGCHPIAASVDRTVMAYLTDTDLVLRTAGGTRRIALAPESCMREGVDELSVSAGGHKVAAYGTATIVAFDFLAHSKHVTASCVLDVATRREQDVSDFPSRVWIGDELRPAQDLPVLLETCAVMPTVRGAFTACLSAGMLVFRRFRLEGRLVQDGGEVRRPARDIGSLAGIALSRDGRLAVYWGISYEPLPGEQQRIRGRLFAVEVATGRELLAIDQTGEISGAELDPGGGDAVLVVDRVLPAGQYDHNTRARILRGGRVLHEQVHDGTAETVYWTEPGAYWVTTGCGARRVPVTLRG